MEGDQDTTGEVQPVSDVSYFRFHARRSLGRWIVGIYQRKHGADSFSRVKLPKSFVAVNLSDAFTFEEHENTENDSDAAAPSAETATHPAGPPEGQDVQSSAENQAENAQGRGGVA